MEYRENKRVDEAVETIDWLKSKIEDLELENEKLEEKVEGLEYEIGVLNGTKQR